MTWNDNLSPEQLTASSPTVGHTRLLAGPGTGKTLCLTRRVLRMIEAEGVAPSQILVITFTRAARAELKKRIRDDLGSDDKVPSISTLHSYALRMLFKHPDAAPLYQPLRITDDWEDRWIVQEEIRSALNLDSVRGARELLSKLSADWETLKADSADWETHFPDPAFLGAWREHSRVYGYTLRGELVYRLKKAIEEGKLEGFAPPRHVVVDEYQDLNACDLAVVHALAHKGSELYCAGDDDQSIYGFRYASPVGIRRFTLEYVPSSDLALVECRRCDRGILNYAISVAKQDPRRLPKDLRPSPTAGEGLVKVLFFPNQNREAEGIARVCKHLIAIRGLRPGNILILLRSDRDGVYSNPILAELSASGVPSNVGTDPLAPLNEDDGRAFLSVLRLFKDERDSLAWRSILQTRQNRIGYDSLLKVYEGARFGGVRFVDKLDEVVAHPEIVGRIGPRIQAEVEFVKALLAKLRYETASDGLGKLLQAASVACISDPVRRAKVMGLAQTAIDLTGAADIGDFLRGIQTALGDKEAERDPEKVSIMTMHQAKGLTADAVVVAAAENEIIPGDAAGDDLDDERRLLYVSVSRARHDVYVTYCNGRTGRQQFSGSRLGNRNRSLTQFLVDSPVRPENGDEYTSKLQA